MLKTMSEIKEEIQSLWTSGGHLNENQRDFLISVLLELKPRYCLEIGFATGRSCVTILASTCLVKMVSVDIDLDYSKEGREYVSKLKQKYKELRVIEKDSRELFTKGFFEVEYPNGIDFIFVDGGHTYDCAYNDIEKTYAYLNRGGRMIVDDYYSGPPDGCSLKGVNKAVNNFCLKNNIKIVKWYKNGKGFAILEG